MFCVKNNENLMKFTRMRKFAGFNLPTCKYTLPVCARSTFYF